MPKGYLKVIERVPVSFTRRGGDWVQEGGNNTLIVLGTDRAKPDGPATVDDGLGTVEADSGGKGAGTIAAVVGRKDLEGGNIDVSADDAFVYLSMKTRVDENLGTTFESSDTGPAAAVKADHVRLVFRKNLKVSATEKATHVHLDDDRLHIDMQGKARVSLDVSGDDSVATIDVQDNTITVKSDGTITVASKSQVIVHTKSAEVHAEKSALVQSPAVVIQADDTTITGKLHVGGDTDIAGATTVAQTLAVALTAEVLGVASVGGLAPAAGAPAIPGGIKMAGDVETAGDVRAGPSSLLTHTHLVPGVKSGPDVGTTLNVGASAALASQIRAARQAAEEAARRAAEEQRRAEEEAARLRAEAAAAPAGDPVSV